MYEPHWSAANRYLEMSSPEGSSIVDPAGIGGGSTNPSSPTTPQQHYSLTRQYMDDTKETSDKILMVHNALKNPTSQLPSHQQVQQGHFPMASQRIQHVRLPGAVPASWAHPSELETRYGTESGVSDGGTSTGAHPPTPAARRAPSGTKKADASGAGVPSPLSKDTVVGIAMDAEQRVGTNGTSTTKSTTTTENTTTGGAGIGTGAGTGVGAGPVARAATATPRRAMTSGSGGVTKEDLQQSAERIYYKYLIPQAEKRVRIPGEVRQRVARLMDSKMMNKSGVGQPPSATASTGFEEGNGGGAEPSNPVFKRKNKLGNSTTTTSSQQNGMLLSPNPDLSNEKVSSVSEPAPHRFPSPTKEKQQKNRLSSASINNPNRNSVGPGGVGPSNSTLQQPDQDLGLVFAEAREIVFEGMESYYFPRFLEARAYGNMVPFHRFVRVVVGLFLLFVGFASVLVLIFLNIRPRSLRAWVSFLVNFVFFFLAVRVYLGGEQTMKSSVI